MDSIVQGVLRPPQWTQHADYQSNEACGGHEARKDMPCTPRAPSAEPSLDELECEDCEAKSNSNCRQLAPHALEAGGRPLECDLNRPMPQVERVGDLADVDKWTRGKQAVEHWGRQPCGGRACARWAGRRPAQLYARFGGACYDESKGGHDCHQRPRQREGVIRARLGESDNQADDSDEIAGDEHGRASEEGVGGGVRCLAIEQNGPDRELPQSARHQVERIVECRALR